MNNPFIIAEIGINLCCLYRYGILVLGGILCRDMILWEQKSVNVDVEQ